MQWSRRCRQDLFEQIVRYPHIGDVSGLRSVLGKWIPNTHKAFYLTHLHFQRMTVFAQHIQYGLGRCNKLPCLTLTHERLKMSFSGSTECNRSDEEFFSHAVRSLAWELTNCLLFGLFKNSVELCKCNKQIGWISVVIARPLQNRREDVMFGHPTWNAFAKIESKIQVTTCSDLTSDAVVVDQRRKNGWFIGRNQILSINLWKRFSKLRNSEREDCFCCKRASRNPNSTRKSSTKNTKTKERRSVPVKKTDRFQSLRQFSSDWRS